MLVAGCQKNESCSKILNFLEIRWHKVRHTDTHIRTGRQTRYVTLIHIYGQADRQGTSH